jgi:3-dehydrotetronate 4-kinase
MAKPPTNTDHHGWIGVAMGLPEAHRSERNAGRPSTSDASSAPQGRAAILVGSCSTATRRQVEVAIEAGLPALRIDPLALASGQLELQSVVAGTTAQSPARPVLVYSSAPPNEVREIE